jgi:hypothetical protein
MNKETIYRNPDDYFQRNNEILQHKVFNLMGELDIWKAVAEKTKIQLIDFSQKNKELEKELDEVTKGFKRFELLDL